MPTALRGHVYSPQPMPTQSRGHGTQMNFVRNIALTIAYDGTEFQGWQTQPGYRTVQETLEAAIAALTGEPRIRLNASGRTDAGVHAVGQVANFYTATHHPAEVILRAVNARLPADVILRDAVQVPQAFDANHDA